MALSAEQVRKVADLARLDLAEEEVLRFRGQLEHVLDYVRTLDELDTTSVEPLISAVEVSNILRADVPQLSLPRSDALSNAPETDGRYFIVPAILGD